MGGRLDEGRKLPIGDSQGKLGGDVKQFNNVLLELHRQSR